MSPQELQRYHLIRMVIEGRVDLAEAAERMQVSYRQAKRIKAHVQAEGAPGVLHHNRGRTPANSLTDELRQQVQELSQGRYAQCNDTHFTELLAQREGITVSRETVRTWRREDGQAPKRRRRAGQQRRLRRERKPAEGMMMLWDGSPHPWFGPDRPPCCLMAAIDDATGKVLALHFLPTETSAGYLTLLRGIVDAHGIPCSVYQDRHGALKRNDSHWSLKEQLAGRQEPTQVGTALEALGIQAIFALSPEAKGRVERLNGTLQDRLSALLALDGITDIGAGNAYVENGFREEYNHEFAVAPSEATPAWMPVPKGMDLDRLIAFCYQATVGKDNAVRLGGQVLDIPAGPRRCGYAKQVVEVRQLLDGRWRIYHGDVLLGEYLATPVVEPLRRRKPHPDAPGADDADWLYPGAEPAMQAPTVGRAGRSQGGGIRAARIA